MSETEMKVKIWELYNGCKALEERVIALERALEAVLTRIEDAEHPQAHGHDQPGWFGVTE